MKIYDRESVLNYFTSFSSCCGAYYCADVSQLNTHNIGFTVMLVKTEEFDETKLLPECAYFRYDFVVFGEYTLIVKERTAV